MCTASLGGAGRVDPVEDDGQAGAEESHDHVPGG